MDDRCENNLKSSDRLKQEIKTKLTNCFLRFLYTVSDVIG